MKQLLVWTCGPVQDFIASARKGRDLWFGSWLLSELSTAAAVAALDRGAEILIPSVEVADELLRPDFDVPNRVMLVLPGSPDDAAELGRAMSEAAHGRLRGYADDTFDAVERRGRGLFDRVPALDQVADLLETYWASVPRTASLDNDRRRVEGLLAARKSARHFSVPSYARAGVPKDSLDGTREAVTRGLGDGDRLQVALASKERLSGPGLLKRMGHLIAPPDSPGGRIASVSSHAVAPWLRGAIEEHGVEEVEQAVQAFADELEWDESGHAHRPGLGKVDAHCLYRSRMDELGLPESRFGPALRRLRGRLDLHGEPQPYYAVILADGDHMGRLLSSLETPAQIQRVSEALTAFAGRVRNRVLDVQRPLRGELIYAGGDDVLAFAAVDVVLEVALELRDAFTTEMMAIRADLPADAKLPTLSVGVCVAHHLSPLRDVLTHARAAEGLAKHQAGRNALAVVFAKRSGSPIHAYMRWDSRQYKDFVSLVEHQLGKGGAYPRGLPYQLRDAALRLARGRGGAPAAAALERQELKRILQQKVLRGSREETKGAHDGLLDLFDEVGPGEESALTVLADLLIVARALAGLGAAE